MLRRARRMTAEAGTASCFGARRSARRSLWPAGRQRGKQGGLEAVARALDRGNLALASIGAVLLRFPDPPALTKDAPPRGSAELAAQLAAEGLLKADWDSSKHPRVGAPPNPGWFAATDAPSPPATRETLRRAPGQPTTLLWQAPRRRRTPNGGVRGGSGRRRRGANRLLDLATGVDRGARRTQERRRRGDQDRAVRALGRFGVEARDRSGDRGALVDSSQP